MFPSRPHTLFFVCFATLVIFGWRLAEVSPTQAGNARKYEFWDVSTCIGCHQAPPDAGKKPAPYNTDFARLSEYATWKTEDRHAQAYAVLKGPRGQRIGRLLGIDVTNVKEGAMCLGCHATNFLPGHEGDGFYLGDGVSCDGCHGPAGRWISEHSLKWQSWRKLSPGQKAARDMFDVRDPWKRADLCTSCHVGSPAEGKVVTHAMYAAGHPPLASFELASFSKNLPPHWSDLAATKYFMNAREEKVRKDYRLETARYQHTMLVLAGSVVVARKAMELLAARAEMGPLAHKYGASAGWPPPWLQDYFKQEARKRWPELEIGEKLKAMLKIELPDKVAERWPEVAMAQSDCYACHHELKSPSWRQARGYHGRPGRPQFQSWSLTLAALTLTSEERQEHDSLLKGLRDAFDARPFGASGAVAAAAKKLATFFAERSYREIHVDDKLARSWLTKLTSSVPPAHADSARSSDDSRAKHAAHEYVDYDGARQIAWAFRAIYLDHWNEKNQLAKGQDVLGILKELDRSLNLSVDSGVRHECAKKRQDLMGKKSIYENTMKDVLTGAGAERFLAELDTINEEELRGNLAGISEYDPALFQKRLAELADLVAGKHFGDN
jgi:Cytochrome c554 and c-prime